MKDWVPAALPSFPLVGVHKDLFTLKTKGCERGQEVARVLSDHKADTAL